MMFLTNRRISSVRMRSDNRVAHTTQFLHWISPLPIPGLALIDTANQPLLDLHRTFLSRHRMQAFEHFCTSRKGRIGEGTARTTERQVSALQWECRGCEDSMIDARRLLDEVGLLRAPHYLQRLPHKSVGLARPNATLSCFYIWLPYSHRPSLAPRTILVWWNSHHFLYIAS